MFQSSIVSQFQTNSCMGWILDSMNMKIQKNSLTRSKKGSFVYNIKKVQRRLGGILVFCSYSLLLSAYCEEMIISGEGRFAAAFNGYRVVELRIKDVRISCAVGAHTARQING